MSTYTFICDKCGSEELVEISICPKCDRKREDVIKISRRLVRAIENDHGKTQELFSLRRALKELGDDT